MTTQIPLSDEQRNLLVGLVAERMARVGHDAQNATGESLRAFGVEAELLLELLPLIAGEDLEVGVKAALDIFRISLSFILMGGRLGLEGSGDV